MSKFSRNLTHLKTAWPPKEGKFKPPDELVDAVFLSEPLLGSSLWEVASTYILTGALAQNPIDAAVFPAQNKVWYVQSVKALCDDPVARNLTIKLIDTLGNALAITPTYMAAAANQYVGPDRAFWVPSLWKFRVNASGLAAGQRLILEVVYGEYDLGVTPPPC